MPFVNSFCGCCSLKQGTIVAAVINIAAVILWLSIVFAVCPNEKDACCGPYDNVYKVFYSIFGFLWILSGILLLVGVFKSNRWYILPWLILYDHMILASSDFTATTGSKAIDNKCSNWAGAIWLTSGLIFVPFDAYLWVVVLCHYVELRDEA